MTTHLNMVSEQAENLRSNITAITTTNERIRGNYNIKIYNQTLHINVNKGFSFDTMILTQSSLNIFVAILKENFIAIKYLIFCSAPIIEK